MDPTAETILTYLHKARFSKLSFEPTQASMVASRNPDPVASGFQHRLDPDRVLHLRTDALSPNRASLGKPPRTSSLTGTAFHKWRFVKKWHILLLLFSVSVVCLTWAHWETPLPKSAKADRIVILKGRRELQLLLDGIVEKTYSISLGRGPIGPKAREGDGKTPEGIYRIDSKNGVSRFHRALHISYPTTTQRDTAQKKGLRPGGDIMIHGLPRRFGWLGKLHRIWDWTDGCVAITNPEMDELWRAVTNGTVIEIRP